MIWSFLGRKKHLRLCSSWEKKNPYTFCRLKELTQHWEHIGKKESCWTRFTCITFWECERKWSPCNQRWERKYCVSTFWLNDETRRKLNERTICCATSKTSLLSKYVQILRTQFTYQWLRWCLPYSQIFQEQIQIYVAVLKLTSIRGLVIKSHLILQVI